MATYYVRTDGSNANAGTADSAAGAWADPGYGASQLTAGDLLYVKSGTYNLSTTTPGAGGPIQYPNQLQCRIEGYETTAGDRCPNDSFPVLNANGNAPTNMVEMRPNFNSPQTLDCFKIDGNSQAVVGVLGGSTATVGRYSTLVRVTCADCDGSYAFRHAHATACVAFSCSANGFDACWSSYCVADTCTNGFLSSSTQGYAHINCIAVDCTSDGFVGDYVDFVNCTAHSNGSDGFAPGFCCSLINCLSTSNTGYGFNATQSDAVLFNCADYNNTTDRASTVFNDVSSVRLTGDPYTNAASGDFSLNSTAGAGAACRDAGIGADGQTVPNIGAIGYTASGGGGTTGRQGLHAIESGGV